MENTNLILLVRQNSKQYAILNEKQAFEIMLAHRFIEVVSDSPFDSLIVLDDETSKEETIEVFNSCYIDYRKDFESRIQILNECDFVELEWED